ncbi:MAG: hypothetical protein ACRD1K_12435 [Acidimicrobiales bacterium]
MSPDAWAEPDREAAGIADDTDWAELYGVAPPWVLRNHDAARCSWPRCRVTRSGRVLVMTGGSIISRLHSVIAEPVTSTARAIPSEVALGAAEGLLRRLGALSDAQLGDACVTLRFATGG